MTLDIRNIFAVLTLFVNMSLNPGLRHRAEAHEQQLQAKVDEPRLHKALDTDLSEALKTIASTFQIPMVVELSDRLPMVGLPGGTSSARNLLDKIIEKNPEYLWKVKNSTIHFYHRKVVADPQNFLNLVLKSFTISGTIADVDLHLKAEINKTLAGVTKPGGLVVGIRPSDLDNDKLPTSVLQDVSVREILFKVESLQPRLYTAVVFPRSEILNNNDVLAGLASWQWLSLEQPGRRVGHP